VEQTPSPSSFFAAPNSLPPSPPSPVSVQAQPEAGSPPCALYSSPKVSIFLLMVVVCLGHSHMVQAQPLAVVGAIPLLYLKLTVLSVFAVTWFAITTRATLFGLRCHARAAWNVLFVALPLLTLANHAMHPRDAQQRIVLMMDTKGVEVLVCFLLGVVHGCLNFDSGRLGTHVLAARLAVQTASCLLLAFTTHMWLDVLSLYPIAYSTAIGYCLCRAYYGSTSIHGVTKPGGTMLRVKSAMATA